MSSSGGLLLRVLRAEGVRAVVDRVRDRLSGRWWVHGRSPLALGEVGAFPVLTVSPMPLSPLRGGSLIQLLDRLQAAAPPVALLSPGVYGWQLSVRSRQRWQTAPVAASRLDTAVAAVIAATGAVIVHVECLSGLDAGQVALLAQLGCRLVLTVHDFSLLCERPHLLAQPEGRPCGLEHDLERCRSCLGHDRHAGDGHDLVAGLRRRRLDAAAALAAADAVLFVSPFLRDSYRSFLARRSQRLQGARQHVVAPASATVAMPPARPLPDRIAFVGGIKEIKGGALVPELVHQVRAVVPSLAAVAFGEVEPHLAPRVRRLPGFRVRGYYRAGHLPRLLRRSRVSLAVLPSVVPESYNLVVDECLRAGVPVVAFDHGAVGQRLRELGIGRLVPLAAGADGLAGAVVSLLREPLQPVPEQTIKSLPTPAQVSGLHDELYRELVGEQALRCPLKHGSV